MPSRINESRNSHTKRILLLSFVVSFFVFGLSLALQWVIYDALLHHSGPLRVIGSTIAAVLTFMVFVRWQRAVENRQARLLRRFETIADMNDRIRNALQVIECTTYIADPQAAQHVRQAVAVIDDALRGVVAEVNPARDAGKKKGEAANTSAARKSA